MSNDLDAKLKASFDDLVKHILERMDQMETTLVEEFRQSTARIEAMSGPVHRSGDGPEISQAGDPR